MKKTVKGNMTIYTAEYGDTHDYMGNEYPSHEQQADALPPAIIIDTNGDDGDDAEQKDPALKAAIDKLMREHAERDKEDAQNSPGRLLERFPPHYVGTSDLTPNIEDDLGTPRHEYESGETYTRPKTRTLDDLRASLWEILYRLRLFPEAGDLPELDVTSLSGDEVREAVRRYGHQLLCILGPRHFRQLAREDEALNAGIARYRAQVMEKQRTGRASESGIGESIMGRYVAAVSDRVVDFMEVMGTPGPFGLAQKVLKDIEPDVAAYIAVKLAFDAALQTSEEAKKWNTLARRIGDAIIAEILLDKTPFENSSMQISLAKHRAIHEGRNSARARESRAKIDRQIEEEVERRRCEVAAKQEAIKAGKAFLKFEKSDSSMAGQRMLYFLIEAARAEQQAVGRSEPAFSERFIYRQRGQRPRIFQAARWLVDEYLMRHMKKADEHALVRPMLTFPSPWILSTAHTGILPGGYRGALRTVQGGKNLVKTNNPDHLALLDRAVVGQSLLRRTIHGLQNTAFRINKRVFAAVEDIEAEPIEAKELTPIVPKERHDFSEKSTDEKKRMWSKWFKKEAAQRLSVVLTIAEARSNRDEPILFFPHEFDFRGRVYPVGGHLNPQGSDLTRSLLEFAEGKRLGSSEVVNALAVHGANCSGDNGIDKKPLAERVQWVHDHEDEIRRIADADTPLDSDLWREAKDKWQFLAFCYDWQGYLDHGQKHVSHLPIYADGTCNGYQHFSALMRNRSTGELVGMTAPDPDKTHKDLYTTVAEVVAARIRTDSNGHGESSSLAKRILQAVDKKPVNGAGFMLGRSLAKKPIMTFGYGATAYGMNKALRKKLRDDYDEGEITEEQWNILTESHAAVDQNGTEVEYSGLWAVCDYLAALFFEAIQTAVGGAAEARDWLTKAGNRLAGYGRRLTPNAIQWRSPSGFPVLSVKYNSINQPIPTKIYGRRHKIANYVQTDEIDAKRTAGGFAPNVIHSLDAAHLMFTIDRCLSVGMRSFVTTHDCFGCLAADMPRMGRIIRQAFVDMYRDLDMVALAKLLSEANGVDLSAVGEPR